MNQKTALLIGVCISGLILLASVGFDTYLKYRAAELVLGRMNESNREPSSQDLVENIRRFLPYDEKLTSYFNLLGVGKHGIGNSSMNSGHVAYFENRGNANTCFVDLAAEYFRLIKMYDKKVGIYSKIGDTTLLKSRPTIVDRIGEGNRTHVKPGYAWDLALRMSQGDKHLALSLVASCGHDDEIRSFSPLVICPDRTSSLYVPGSLGAEVTLDPKVINQIVSVQAPTLGGKAIPAKYYHTIASAFTACMAIKEGVPAWMLKRAQIYAVRTYRAKRLCDRFSELIDSSPSLSMGQIDSQELLKTKESFEKIPLDEQEIQAKQFFSSRNAVVKTRQVGGKVLINEMSFEGAVADYNARFLFVQTFPTAVQCNPKTVSELVSLLGYKSKLSDLTGKTCPKTWNQDRCKDATRKVKTWITDFEWSEAAQGLGVDFASKNCPSLKSGQSMDQNSCSALKAWTSGGSGGLNSSTQNSGAR